METSATDVEFDFGMVNLSGSADVDVGKALPEVLRQSIHRVERDTLEHREPGVSCFQSAI
ncbi:hypothetical protein AQJ54_32305 [Streptomyces griseorubiginosus]|uniref:FXSXX-COOH protein n=1 Tax=Streptomyces griseorubiginosus TaxID=67304 RepID=A0A117QZ02_9ACTN|nr:hypothetical protein AQJ54_32305 [Streptomyces griseorubiginosus]